MGDTLLEIVRRQKAGEQVGICSVCSSSPFVIDAALTQALEYGTDVLIEATANQVNQFGGYTGMKPADFRDWVMQHANAIGLDRERVILGGDHLGPVAWKKESVDEAMDKAEGLVRAFAKAGFTKIHLDCSMPLGEEVTLSTEEIAERTVRLCKASEEEFEKSGNKRPVYVIGSEVPTPGGSGEEDDLSVTKPEALKEMLACFEEKFKEAGLANIPASPWSRVVAAVVQPGVEFGNDSVHEYVPEEAAQLTQTAAAIPNIVLEGHSTDYQSEESLSAMVKDGIAILKVGPALTFAAREGLFELEEIEKESLSGSEKELSRFAEVLDQAMRKDPSHWEDHYTSEEPESTRLRKYSLSDRSRYYMNVPEVQEALGRLMNNIENEPERFVIDKVREVLDHYWRACGAI